MPRDWEHSTTDRDNLQNTHTTNHSQSMNISPDVECVCVCFAYHEIWKGGSVASTSAKSSSSDESNSLVLIAPVYHRHKCNDTKIIINPDTDIYMRAQCGTAIQTAACSDAFAYHVGVRLRNVDDFSVNAWTNNRFIYILVCIPNSVYALDTSKLFKRSIKLLHRNKVINDRKINNRTHRHTASYCARAASLKHTYRTRPITLNVFENRASFSVEDTPFLNLIIKY